ncbi:hypothetical protein ACHAXA_000713 [Cyclostephanos tholiformis]|uniref:Uncharacterized protein n=1 Tax=Cyclostephanos tholiformis TaxID=382380 RepID=A0ABD3RTL0_9STRA
MVIVVAIASSSRPSAMELALALALALLALPTLTSFLLLPSSTSIIVVAARPPSSASTCHVPVHRMGRLVIPFAPAAKSWLPAVVPSLHRGGGTITDDDDDDDDDQRRRLDDALLRLADGIIQRLVTTTTTTGWPGAASCRALRTMPTLDVAFDGRGGHDDRDDDRDHDDGEGRWMEETPWVSYSRHFLEVAFRRLWEARLGRRTTTTMEGGTSRMVMETTVVSSSSSSSSSSSDPQAPRYVVDIDVSRGILEVTTIDGMTTTRDAVATGSTTFEELCMGVRREMRLCRRRPSPPTPTEDEARASSLSSLSSCSSSVEDSTHASIVVNDRGGEGEEGTMVDGVLLPITTTTMTRSTGVDRSVRSAMTQRQYRPPTKMTTTKSAKIRRELELAMVAAIARAEERLMEMECEMDESSLAVGVHGDNDEDELEGDDDEGLMARGGAMQRFGDRVDEIVDDLSSTFLAFIEENGDVMTKSDQLWAKEQRISALKQVLGGVAGVQRLFHLQLQGLRDHFGRLYEDALSDSPLVAEGDMREWESRRRAAAREAQEGFERSAYASIPRICRRIDGELCDDGKLVDMFGFIDALRGLLEDMYDATTARGLNEEGVWEDKVADEVQSVDESQRRRIPKTRVGLRQVVKRIKTKIQQRGPARWYERLAAKIFVIGVNYVQGWIVLQSLRREARRRDLAMPKFPLF